MTGSHAALEGFDEPLNKNTNENPGSLITQTMKTLITIIRSVVALVGVAGRNSLSAQFQKS